MIENYVIYLKFLDEKFNRFFKKQKLFEQLLKHKEEIEYEIGHLEWASKENNKSSKIRKIFEIDINNSDNHECAINEHIKMSTELKNIVHKYL